LEAFKVKAIAVIKRTTVVRKCCGERTDSNDWKTSR